MCISEGRHAVRKQGIQRKAVLLRTLPEDLACVQVIARDVGIFNDTLVRDLLEDLGQLKESDIVLVNWGAWYPRFTWGRLRGGNFCSAQYCLHQHSVHYPRGLRRKQAAFWFHLASGS